MNDEDFNKEQTFDRSVELSILARMLADKFSVNRALGIDDSGRSRQGHNNDDEGGAASSTTEFH